MITRNGYVRQSAGGFRDEEGKKDFAFENENPNSGGGWLPRLPCYIERAEMELAPPVYDGCAKP